MAAGTDMWADHNKRAIAVGAFVAIWFVMDLVQFIDWCAQYLRPAAVVCK